MSRQYADQFHSPEMNVFQSKMWASITEQKTLSRYRLNLVKVIVQSKMTIIDMG